MVYKASFDEIMMMFVNEESIEIDIKKLDNKDFLITLTTDSGLSKKFITDNYKALFAS